MGVLMVRKLKPIITFIVTLSLAQITQATSIYDDQYTRFDIYGQIRLINSWDTEKNKTIIGDDGSRIGFYAEHKLPHEVKVFGNIELGLDTQKSNSNNPNSRFELYNRVGYIGVSHAEYGKAQFGRTYMPIDSVAKSNLGYNNTGVLYFADVLGRNTGISSGFVAQQNGNTIYRGTGQDNFTLRLPHTIFLETPAFKGVTLAGSYSRPAEGSVERDFGDIIHAYSLGFFYQNALGFELATGWAEAVGEKNQTGKKPQDNMFALGVKYVFPDKTASIGIDYGRLQSANVVVAGQKLSPTAVTGDWAAHLYGITAKWYWPQSETGLYAGYGLRSGDKKTFDYTKQTYTLGVDKEFAVIKSSQLLLYMEMAYNHVHSKNHAYEKDNWLLVETGLRFFF